MIEDMDIFLEDMKEAGELGQDVAGRIRVRDYNKIVFCGIGGSAFPGEVVKSLDFKIPVFVVKEEMPEFVNEKTLCFVVSYSGNTAETIRLYEQAKQKGCKIVIVTSGGRLRICKGERVLIPGDYLPREAFIWLLFPVLNILGINCKDCLRVMKGFRVSEIRKIARKLKDKIPIVYCSSENLRFLCYRWQTFFNENSKALAHSNYFPELAHNEIEAEVSSQFQRILLFDKKTKQIEKALKLLKPIEIELKGRSLLSKIVYGTYFGYMLSYYLAKFEGVDYKKIEKINVLKG